MDNWLSHLSILDLGPCIPASFCTKLLSQMGAEVIKVEPPVSGDPARRHSPFHHDQPHPEGSGLFLYLNTGKKGITLDPFSASGARVFRELVRRSDVLVEGYRPRRMSDAGLSYKDLSRVNPGLVMVSITPFGQYGPYRDYKANELIEFAISGLMYPSGFPEESPVQSGGYLPQYKAGLVGVIGALAALQWRDMTGQGQQLDVSMLEVAANFLETTLILYSYQGVIRGRTGSTLMPPTPMCDMYQCKDGYLIITVLTQQQFQSFCEAIGHPELLTDPGSSNPRAMTEAGKARMWDTIRCWCRQQKTNEAFELFQLMRIPCAKVMTPEEIARDPHLLERQFFQTVEHPRTGAFGYPTSGLTVCGQRGKLGRAPLLGEHNEEVYLRRLGFSSRELESLGVSGAV